VGNTIRVKVLEVSAGTVRLGFEAPAEVSIYREEIHLEIARANRAAIECSGAPDEDPDADEDPKVTP
jgi:carbon storage regulator